MSVASEIAHLRRAVDAFVAGVNADLGSRTGLSQSQRSQLRAEIETVTQRLDELRSKLGSS